MGYVISLTYNSMISFNSLKTKFLFFPIKNSFHSSLSLFPINCKVFPFKKLKSFEFSSDKQLIKLEILFKI